MKKARILESSLAILLVIAIALFSFFGIAPYASDSTRHTTELTILKNQERAVAGLSGSMALASIAIAAVPGDSTTPVADEIAGLAGYLALILVFIITEKFLLTAFGFISFKILIPLACLLYILKILLENEQWKKWAIRIFIIALILVMIIPCSIYATKAVSDTDILQYQDTLDKAEEETESSFEGAKQKFNEMVDALVILIVANCLIPLGVLLIFITIINKFLHTNISIPSSKKAKVFREIKAVSDKDEEPV